MVINERCMPVQIHLCVSVCIKISDKVLMLVELLSFTIQGSLMTPRAASLLLDDVHITSSKATYMHLNV